MSLTPHASKRRDRFREIFGGPSASGQSQTSATSHRTTSPIRIKPRISSSIFADALEALDYDDRTVIRNLLPANAVGIDDAIQGAHNLAIELQQQCALKRLSWQYKGRQTYLSDHMGKILQLLEKVKSAGDVAVSVDPVHGGLPWAGIRIILEIALAESHQRAALITGLELTLFVSNRLKVYQDIYAVSSQSLAAVNFRAAIVELYAKLLGFLARAVRTQQRSSTGRLAHAFWDSTVLTKFEEDCDKLCVRASEEARLCGYRTSSEVQLRSLDEIDSVHKSVLDLRAKIDLGKLKTADEATYNSATEGELSQCLPDTRTDLLEQVAGWTADASSKRIFWLCGKAGTGKSTIARTVAKSLDDAGILGASFFFKRGHADRSHAKLLFPTIALQLSQLFPEIAGAIAASLDKDSLLCNRYLNTQFEQLVKQPLESIGPGSLASKGVVLVIDALDECDSGESIKKILLLLSKLGDSTLLRLRVFVTSRPELPVELGFMNLSGDLHQDVRLEVAQARTIAHDIRLFYEHQFNEIRKESSLHDDDLPYDWPGEQVTRTLIDRALPLFIFAFTVSRYISANPRRNLATLLQQSRSPSLNGLKGTYLPILNQVVASEGEGSLEERILDFRYIVGSIVLLYNPLSTSALAFLLEVRAEHMGRVLRPLHSVLNIPRKPNGTTDRTLPITLFHLSFRDLLIDPNLRTENPFWIEENEVHRTLGRQCIRILQSGTLKENMCGAASPGVRRSDIEQSAVNASLPEAVAYACRYWAQHVVRSGHKIRDNDATHQFLKKHLLHWMEASSWLGEASNVMQILRKLQSVICTNEGKQLSSLLYDAERFALHNRYIIDAAPMQIYLSSLLFAPTTSATRQIFGENLRYHFNLLPRVQDRWGAEKQRLEGHQNPVTAIAFSPHGNVMVSSAIAHEVILWDTATGEERQKFDQVSIVEAIAISPDGNTVAVGLYNHTVSLWDVITGEERQILRGHSAIISVLAFSPDNKTLLSVSRDGKVIVWNMVTGQTEQELEYDGQVSAVIFSPDATKVVLQSEKTVTLSNIVTGERSQEVGLDFSSTNSAVSPDGKVVAIRSYDHTIRLLDAKTGIQARKLSLRTFFTSTITFSPDSKTIAVGFQHGTITVWDIESGKEKQHFEGHLGSIKALAFSPDNSVLASGSEDKTIRLWDLSKDEKPEEPEEPEKPQEPEGNRGAICAISLSPDGRIVASGSKTRVAALWDVETGMERQRLEMEYFAGPLSAVAFLDDGKEVAGFGASDSTVRLWDSTTGRLEGKLRLENARRRETKIVGPDHDTASVASPRSALSLDPHSSSWIKYRGADFLWLPHEYRGECYDTSGSIIAVGQGSGAITIISFR